MTALKYLGFVVIFIIVMFFYFFYTAAGNTYIYNYLSEFASKKSDLKIEVLSVKLKQFPYIRSEMLVQDKYKLTLYGILSDAKVNMDYILNSTCIESHICNIDDKVEIKGHLEGSFEDIGIEGNGTMLDGHIRYRARKHPDAFRNIDLTFEDVNSTKLLTLFGQNALFKGQSNAYIHFDYIGKKGQKGHITYAVEDKNFSGLPVKLRTDININDDIHTFTMDFIAPSANLHLVKGVYNQAHRQGSATYVLDIQNLEDFESILGQKVAGPFRAFGEINYDKHLSMQGISKSFGGIIDILYAHNTFTFFLEDVPLSPLMQQFSYAPVLDTNMSGKIHYDTHKNYMKTEIKLAHAKILQTEFISTIYEKFDLDLSQEVFDNSSIVAVYKNQVLSSSVKIANDKNYLILKDSTLNATQKSIDSTIDLQINKHNISGKLYARLDHYSNHSLDAYLHFDGLLEKHYSLKLYGLVNDSWINMDYALRSARLPTQQNSIDDNVSLTGHLNGPFTRLHIRGKGTALDGNMRYDSIKIGNKLENLTLSMHNISGEKLASVLNQPALPNGKASINASFAYISDTHKKGEIKYTVKDATLDNNPLALKAKLSIDGYKHYFNASISLANADLNISQGVYHSDNNISSAFYNLGVKDLRPFETLLGYQYKGPFYATGQIYYDKDLEIRGLSKTFEGLVDFLYKEEMLYIDLKAVSFKYIMNLFPYPLMLDANTTGHINYNFKKDSLLVKAQLAHAQFLHSELVDTIYEKSDVAMMTEVFDDSTLSLNYANNILLANLILSNKESHFSLTNANMNTEKNTIDAYFDFKMQKQEFSGKIYGSLDDPKVNLNMQKLIKYQMDKQLDSMVGKSNREMMENMPMGDVAKDVASGMGASFMGMFF